MVKDNVAQMQARAEQITNLRVFSIFSFCFIVNWISNIYLNNL